QRRAFQILSRPVEKQRRGIMFFKGNDAHGCRFLLVVWKYVILRWPRSGPRRMQLKHPGRGPSRLAPLAPQGDGGGFTDRRHSTQICESWNSWRQRGSSVRMRFASGAGEPEISSKYCTSRKSCLTLGSAKIARTSVLILATISGGTPAGPNSPNHDTA